MLRKPFLRSSISALLRRHRDIDYRTRSQSSLPGERGKSYIGITIAAVGVAGIGGALYYASTDPAFRKTLGDNLPTAKSVLDSLYGPQPERVETIATKGEPSQIDFNEGLLSKKLERDSKKSITSTTNLSTANSDVPPLTSPSIPSPPIIKDTGSSKKSFETENDLPRITLKTKTDKDEAKDNASTKQPDRESNHRKSSTKKKSKPDIFAFPNSEDLELSRSELEQEFARKEEILRHEYENELKKQLKRQLDIHMEHLEEREEELMHTITHDAHQEIIEIRRQYANQLASVLSKLSDLATTLHNRESLDIDEAKSREVWLLCQKLRDALKSDGANSRKCPLKSEITQAIKAIESMEEPSSLAITVLKSIPEVALQSGVYNEDTLVERFKQVNKVCRRVALVGDDGGTLGQYMLSYIQSLLIRDSSINVPQEELESRKPVDVSKLDTFELLARVRMCLAKRDLELALRYANQLRGEARKVASDWIMDTRLHLEVRQAAEILQTLATSTTLRSLN